MNPVKVQIQPWSNPPFGSLSRWRRWVTCVCGQEIFAGCSAFICPSCGMFIGPWEPPLEADVTCNRNGERR